MTLLFRNVQLLGAAQKYEGPIDVFVSGDKISAIGNFPAKPADTVIDGQGAYLAPGFIDVNTDSDHYLTLFDDPAQGDFLRQGVTTIIGGNCGASLAPLLYGGLESIQKWTDTSRFNVGWHTVAEFLAHFDKHPLGVNFGTLVGHSTIRRALIGEVLRDLTKNELTVFVEILRRAMAEGAFGLSTGLAYVHSRQTPYAEIKLLVEVVAQEKGVYTTHLRKTEKGVADAVDETLRLSHETGVSTIISHFLAIRGNEEEYRASLEKINGLPESATFHFDIYPFETTVLPLYTFLPVWVQNGGVEVMRANITDKWMQQRIVKDLPKIEPLRLKVAAAPGNDILRGKTLGDLMDMFSLRDPAVALMKLMTTTMLKASVFYKNVNNASSREAMKSSRSLIASNAASMGTERKMERIDRGTETFPQFLSLVQNENLISLDDAIRKITIIPGQLFNIKKRGEIREGNFADLTLFRGKEILYTVVNGVIAFQNGALTGACSGMPLKHYGV